MMTGYQARWDNSPIKADALTMFARTIRSFAAIRPMGSQETITPRTLGTLITTTQRSSASHTDLSDAHTTGCALGTSVGDSTNAGDISNGNLLSRGDDQPLSDSPSKLPDETTNPTEADSPAHLTNEPLAEPLQPVLAKPEDWSDLIALAGDDHSAIQPKPLRRASEPPAPENPQHDSDSLFWPAGLGEMGALESNASEADPLAMLTLEYRQALLSRKSGNVHALKKASTDSHGSAITPQHDPFAELALSSQGESSVFDLLTQGRNIDTLLDSLDAFGSGQIFEADEPHEILALLAPGGLSPRRTSQTAPLARQEHHLVSVDSPMSVPDSTEYEVTASPDEHDR
ncbi:TagK domain-containing protein [Paraburkholderia sp. ZP32-5]|uniref:TagK domain-containing protein n=1 Tax=Paraburkholderia sp. ZP32-5 TaxID=2883245 RepID=UPI001F2D39A2|nr:TagK domain-containing protein [Paraburkholderia sp. ZP32-5]